MTILDRRSFGRFFGAATAGMVLVACDSPKENPNAESGRLAAELLTPKQLAFSEGQPDAPVIMQEFLSMTCPHCARFHTIGMPVLRERFIDDGKLLLVYRDFPLDGMALHAHALVRSLPPTIGLKLQSVLLEQQSIWVNREGNLEPLANLARLAGLSPDRVKAVFANEALLDSIVAERQSITTEYGIDSTPSFAIGLEKFAGGDVDELADWIGGYIT